MNGTMSRCAVLWEVKAHATIIDYKKRCNAQVDGLRTWSMRRTRNTDNCCCEDWDRTRSRNRFAVRLLKQTTWLPRKMES